MRVRWTGSASPLGHVKLGVLMDYPDALPCKELETEVWPSGREGSETRPEVINGRSWSLKPQVSSALRE